MKRSRLIICLNLLAFVIAFATTAIDRISAQQAPLKAAPAPSPTPTATPGPAEVTLPASAIQNIENKSLAARLAQSEVNNFILRIQQAQAMLKTAETDLQNLQKAAQAAEAAQRSASEAAMVAAGIPKDQLDQYEVDGPAKPDGSVKLKRKK